MSPLSKLPYAITHDHFFKKNLSHVKDARVKGVLNMLKKGLSIEDIASFAGLDLEEAKRLINKYRPKPP